MALEAAKEAKTLSQLASDYQVHPNQISTRKKQLLRTGAELFNNGQSRQQQDQAAREVELFEQIGRLKMELEWLKKKATRFD